MAKLKKNAKPPPRKEWPFYVESRDADSDAELDADTDDEDYVDKPIKSSSISSGRITRSGATPSAAVDRRFPFMRLAPETRNTIYKMVYIHGEDYIGAKSERFAGFNNEAKITRNLAFAMSCRQIYEESCGIYFGYNGFSFEDPVILLYFLKTIGIKNRERLTKLAFIRNPDLGRDWDPKLEYLYNKDNDGCLLALRYVRSCINLQALDIYHMIICDGLHVTMAKLLRMENAREFFLTDSTVVKWEEPKWMLDELSYDPRVPIVQFVEMPEDLKHQGIFKVGYHGRAARLFTPQPVQLQFPDEENKFIEQSLETFTERLCEVKMDGEAGKKPRQNKGKLPDIYSSSLKATQSFFTNFKDQDQRHVAQGLKGLVQKFGHVKGMPPMNVEYRDEANVNEVVEHGLAELEVIRIEWEAAKKEKDRRLKRRLSSRKKTMEDEEEYFPTKKARRAKIEEIDDEVEEEMSEEEDAGVSIEVNVPGVDLVGNGDEAGSVDGAAAAGVDGNDAVVVEDESDKSSVLSSPPLSDSAVDEDEDEDEDEHSDDGWIRLDEDADFEAPEYY